MTGHSVPTVTSVHCS